VQPPQRRVRGPLAMYGIEGLGAGGCAVVVERDRRPSPLTPHRSILTLVGSG